MVGLTVRGSDDADAACADAAVVRAMVGHGCLTGLEEGGSGERDCSHGRDGG